MIKEVYFTQMVVVNDKDCQLLEITDTCDNQLRIISKDKYVFQTAEGGSLRPGFAGTLNDSQTSFSEGLWQ